MQSRALGEALASYLTWGRWPANLNCESLSENRFTTATFASEKMYV